MIYDTLEKLTIYKGIHPNLDTAIDFLTTHDLDKLPNGRQEVDGDDVFVKVMDAEYQTADSAPFEAHRLYADIQISLTGDEAIGWLSVGALPEWAQEEETHLFYEHPEADAWLPMKKGTFIILFPQDAHAPCVGVGTGHKAVAKVRVK